jgi:hypothetical protein
VLGRSVVGVELKTVLGRSTVVVELQNGVGEVCCSGGTAKLRWGGLL